MNLFFDSSALLPYYREEHLSASAQRVLRSSQAPACISLLVEVEFASALSRLVRMRELAETDAAQIQNLFAEHCARGLYRILGVSAEHFRLARDWLLARTPALRTLDALHLAGATLSGTQLVTADRILAQAGRRLGVAVRLLK